MKLLKWFGLSLLAVIGGLAATFLIAKLSDGPIGPFPGGPLVAGDKLDSPVDDWSFASTAGEIELQLAQDDSSRTTWLAVVDGVAYIPAATGFPPNKSWHLRAQTDGRALLRIAGLRYPVSLARLEHNGDEFDAVVASLQAQNAMPPGGRDELWLFRVSSR